MERAKAGRTPEPHSPQRSRQDRRGIRDRGPALTLYLDTSAVVKLIIEEQGSAEARSALADASLALTSRLTFVETHSALARMRAGGRLGTGDYRATVNAFAQLWSDAGILEVDRPLVERAAGLARGHALRAYDSVHLASALLAAGAEPLRFACWDADLRSAAAREGLAVLPPDPP